MLHKSSHIITPETFHLLQQLQELPELEGYHLVGGTSLAMQLGHRNSIDLDLFTENEFLGNVLAQDLSQHFSLQADLAIKNTLLSRINEVKVDFISHPHPLVREPIAEDGITFLSMEDIAAMKLNAIIQSGQRLKDFIDIYFLLEHFSVNDMLHFFSVKYDYINPLMALKALTYFDDLDETIDKPKLLKPLLTDQIKLRIKTAALHSKRVFG
ncbi:MAG: nucleotidyl transferase AbiEii/AbiGii toxin family protein [Chitinophagales bacterium]|nr:nucleotidyl transferase AbiEii/AbiGii toxin family protein [Chitinophagales bacterium]